MSFRVRSLVLSVAVCGIVLTSCGGGDSTPSVDKAFCKDIEQLDELDVQTDIGAAARILTELAAKAPNADVRGALELIAPIFTKMSEVDQNDQQAMSEILSMMSSPEIEAASKTLNKYGTEVCGFDNASGSAAPDTNAPSSEAPSDTTG